MQIKITGLDRVMKRIQDYRKSLEERQKQLLAELAKIGVDIASARFSTAQYDGENDVQVSPVPEWVGDNRLFLTASGKAVTFIEFGTGVHYVEQHPNAAALGMVRGTYGQGKGAQDSWGYYGEPGTNGRVVRETDKGPVVVTHGNPPARAMYDAAKEMRSKIVDIAREVYRR